jgi:23S rRNA (uridine2552-2'-O)-methyltransferase
MKSYVNAVVDLGAAPGGWSQVVAGKMGWSDEPERSLTRAKVPLKGNGYGFNSRTKPDKYGTWSTPPVEELEEKLDDFDLQNTGGCQPVGKGTIVAVDLLPIAAIPGVHTLKANFLSSKTEILIKELLTSTDNPEGQADVILSDMAANSSGNKIHDTESSLEICEAVLRFAQNNLRTADSIGRPRAGVLLCVHFSLSMIRN